MLMGNKMATHYSATSCCQIVATFGCAWVRSDAALYAVLRETKIALGIKFGFQDRCFQPLSHPSSFGFQTCLNGFSRTLKMPIYRLPLPHSRKYANDGAWRAEHCEYFV